MASEAEGGAMHPDDAKAGGNTLKLGWQLLAHEGHIHPKLPTPTVVDLGNNKTVDEWEAWTDEQRAKHGNGNGHGASLSIEAQKLLPTPQVDDSKNTGHNQKRRPTLASETYLLPTTCSRDFRDGSAKRIRDGKLQTDTVARAVNELKGTWGKFEPAIRQWETITGNTAPAPTIPDGKNDQHRLNPAFAEWMMGLPAGWITDVDITRNEQLKACGNGVVPQQATLAITQLIQGLAI